MQIAITTFNLENLFSRYARLDDPLSNSEPRIIMTGVTSINYQGNPLSQATTVLERNNTARAILDCAPDRSPQGSRGVVIGRSLRPSDRFLDAFLRRCQ